MKLVALKRNEVVSIETNGVIDTSVEHDRIVSVPDNSQLEIGWIYGEPILPNTNQILFFPPNPIEDTSGFKPTCYAVDENGNQYVVENPEELA